jgi:hypothetical protein
LDGRTSTRSGVLTTISGRVAYKLDLVDRLNLVAETSIKTGEGVESEWSKSQQSDGEEAKANMNDGQL